MNIKRLEDRISLVEDKCLSNLYYHKPNIKMTETKETNTITILVLNEWNIRYKELSSLLAPLNQFKEALIEFNKRSLFNIPFSLNVALNPQDAVLSHVKSLLPDNIGGLPTNKDELLKQYAIPNHTELSLISSKINELSERFNIDLNKFFEVTKVGIELKDDAVEREKRNYSLIATNPSQKALATYYWKLVQSLNAYEKAVTEIVGKGGSIHLKRISDLVSINSNDEFTLKPSYIITEILNPLKHK